MSKVAVGLLVAGIAAMPFVDRGDVPQKATVSYAERDVAAPAKTNQTVYVVSSSTGSSCRIVSEIDASNSVIVKPERTCANVYDGLDRVAKWTADGRGNDALKDASGRTILVVGPSDGFAYEAVTNNGMQISFALSDV